jgi:hypothetical protein
MYIESWPRATTIQVTATTYERAEELVRAMRAQLPLSTWGDVSLRTWHASPNGSVASSDRIIAAPRWEEISRNYPATTRGALDALMALEPERTTARFVLWHGQPGTGKTTALRSLMRHWAPWCQSQYIADPERFFADPAYMATVVSAVPIVTAGPTLTRPGDPEARWRLIVAEDVDEHFRASTGAALGRLLNLTDGILGHGTNVLVLLTINGESSQLHPALLRPGRCLASVDFPSFDAHEASQWLGVQAGRAQTLTELLVRRGDLVTLTPSAQRLAPTGQYL